MVVARRAQESGHAAPGDLRRLVDAHGRVFRTRFGVVPDDGVETTKLERPVGQESGEMRRKKRPRRANDVVCERRSKDVEPRRVDLDGAADGLERLFESDRHRRWIKEGKQV